MKYLQPLTEKMYQGNPALYFIGLSIVTLILQMMSGTTYVMLLSRSRAIAVFLVLSFSLIAGFSHWLALWFLRRFNLEIPTLLLWLYPLITMVFSYILLTALLVGIPAWTNRAFWSDLAQLNAKTTGVMFTVILIAFKFYIGLSFLVALARYLKFWINMFDDVTTFREKIAELEECRLRGKRFNRAAFISVLILCALAGGWMIFLRPEMILYYRGEIQLKTGQYPAVALEIMSHLVARYPEYKFLDSVEFRIPWILERRMGKYAEAVKAYEEFLKKYGPANVWADEVVANMVRVFLDKLKDSSETLKWIVYYREHFPEGQMMPHLMLYEIRALMHENRVPEAKALYEASLDRFRGRQVILYDNEDDFVTALPFEIAALTVYSESFR